MSLNNSDDWCRKSTVGAHLSVKSFATLRTSISKGIGGSAPPAWIVPVANYSIYPCLVNVRLYHTQIEHMSAAASLSTSGVNPYSASKERATYVKQYRPNDYFHILVNIYCNALRSIHGIPIAPERRRSHSQRITCKTNLAGMLRVAVHVAQKEKELLEVTSPFGIWRHNTPRPVLHKLTFYCFQAGWTLLLSNSSNSSPCQSLYQHRNYGGPAAFRGTAFVRSRNQAPCQEWHPSRAAPQHGR